MNTLRNLKFLTVASKRSIIESKNRSDLVEKTISRRLDSVAGLSCPVKDTKYLTAPMDFKYTIFREYKFSSENST